MNKSEASRPQRNSVDFSPIYVISPICFNIYRVGNSNDDISSEEHFENLKNSRGSYLGLQVIIFSIHLDSIS